MKATLPYRIAAGLLVLMAAGHTYGFLHLKPPTQEALAVRDAMDRVHFQAGGSALSYGGFYVGFGLTLSAYLLFSAFLAWHLGSLAARDSRAIGALGWAFFALQLASLVLSCLYLPTPPAIFSGVLALCTGWAAWSARSAR